MTRRKKKDSALETRPIKLNKALMDAVEEVLEARGGTLKDFLELALIGFTRSKSVLGIEDTFTFGKYAGVPVEHVIKNDLEYMFWLVVEQKSRKFKREVFDRVLKVANEEGSQDIVSRIPFHEQF